MCADVFSRKELREILSLSLSLFLFVLRMICVKYFSMRHLWFFECYRRRNIEAYLEYE